jgi:hypothetical protein
MSDKENNIFNILMLYNFNVRNLRFFCNKLQCLSLENLFNSKVSS